MRLIVFIRAVLAATVVSALAAPAPASAQFGSLIKKAKAKIASHPDSTATVESAGAPTGAPQFGMPKFDADLIELTPSVLDRVLHGMTVEVAMLKKRDAEGEKLNAALDAANKEYDQLASQHPDKDRQAWEESHSRISECLDAALEKLKEPRQGEVQARLMSDPAARQKMIDLTQKASAAAQSGDSVASRKIMGEMDAMMFPITKEDSASARKECGTPSAKPAWLVRQEELAQRRSDLASELRELDGMARDSALKVTVVGGGHANGGGAAGGQSVGRLTQLQYSLALERLVGYAAATRPRADGGSYFLRHAKFSPTELQAMKDRDSEMRDLANELMGLNVWR